MRGDVFERHRRTLATRVRGTHHSKSRIVCRGIPYACLRLTTNVTGLPDTLQAQEGWLTNDNACQFKQLRVQLCRGKKSGNLLTCRMSVL